MLINFNKTEECEVSGMYNGSGTMSAKMYMDNDIKIIPCKIHAGGSIGIHKHDTSDDINYIISGEGKAICDDKEEKLSAGVCHVCKKGSEHSIINTGNDDLIILTLVVEHTIK